MHALARVTGLAVILASGWWGYGVAFPSDSKVIRQTLAKLATVAAISPNQAALARLAAPNRVVAFFSRETSIRLAGIGYGMDEIHGRDQLREAVIAARANLRQLEIEFPDLSVRVEPDGLRASVELTALAHINGERNSSVQTLRLTLEKTDGVWAIAQIEPVAVLQH